VTHDPSVHQVFVTKDTESLVVLPGGIGTMNRFSDNIQLMQLKMVERFPIVTVGKRFWRTFMDPIINFMLLQVPILDAATVCKESIRKRMKEYF